jgi:hypothetical protein
VGAALLTFVLTVLAGVLLFAAQRVLQSLVIEPMREQAKVIGQILFGLLYYAREYANPADNRPEVRDAAGEVFRSMRTGEGRENRKDADTIKWLLMVERERTAAAGASRSA